MENNIGGKLQGISLDAFLQMAQTEQITCTLSVASGDKVGSLFLQHGKLISAETGEFTNTEAACRIISWENSVIEIKESCEKTVDEINMPLMNILIEAMRIRDEAESDKTPETPKTSEMEPSQPHEAQTSSFDPAKSTPQTDDSPGKQVDKMQSDVAERKQIEPEKKAVEGPKEKANTQKIITPSDQSSDIFLDLPGQPKRFGWKYAIVGLVILLSAGGGTIYFVSSAKQKQLAYETLISSVNATDISEQKLNLLNAYAFENPDGKYSADVKHRIEILLKQEALEEFGAAKRIAIELITDGNFEAAVAAYEKFIAQTKNNYYVSEATAAIETISNQIEQKDFEDMQTNASLQGPERISLYQAFLEKYPDGKHYDVVLDFISNMENEYYLYMERQILENEKTENWEACHDLSRQFVDAFPDSDHADTLNNYILRCREEIQAARAFEQLSKRAAFLGSDNEAAMAVYSDYLKAYPRTPATTKIKREIERLAVLIEKERLTKAITSMTQKVKELDSRFFLNNNETLIDKQTGLMWCLLDSREAVNKCLTYEEATAYVHALETGGYQDWRLPTPQELSALFEKQPSFPIDKQQWYWSDKAHKRYISQWLIDVEVMDPEYLNGEETITKESWQCGAVRAVRRQ